MKKKAYLLLCVTIGLFYGCSSNEDATTETDSKEIVYVEGIDYNLPTPTEHVSKSNLIDLLSEGGWYTCTLTRVDVDGKQEVIYKQAFNDDGTVNEAETYISNNMPLGISLPQFTLINESTMKCYLFLDNIPALVYDTTTFAYNESKNELTVNDKGHGKTARHIVLSANENDIIITSDVMFAKTKKSVYNILTLHHVPASEVAKWDEKYNIPLSDVK